MFRKVATLQATKTNRRSVKRAADILGDLSLRMMDVGAAGGAPTRWEQFGWLMDYIAVEPDSRSSPVLVESETSQFRSHSVVTKGLWSTEATIDLNLCRKPMTSSVYVPNAKFAAHFPDSDRFEVVGTQPMAVTTIDHVVGSAKRLDGIKLDVQGAEYDVLLGATETLKHTLLVESEVEFVPLYINQPLFSDVTRHLAQAGLEFVDFLYLYRWHPQSLDGTGQLVFADALYMRVPENLPTDVDTLRRYAALSILYGRGDLLIRLARTIADTDLRNRVLEAAEQINTHNSRVNSRLQLLGRMLRMSNSSARAHLFY
ncbi:MAG: hypothetical protein RLZZ327_44 [Actinomycetota bacterium]